MANTPTSTRAATPTGGPQAMPGSSPSAGPARGEDREMSAMQEWLTRMLGIDNVAVLCSLEPQVVAAGRYEPGCGELAEQVLRHIEEVKTAYEASRPAPATKEWREAHERAAAEIEDGYGDARRGA